MVLTVHRFQDGITKKQSNQIIVHNSIWRHFDGLLLLMVIVMLSQPGRRRRLRRRRGRRRGSSQQVAVNRRCHGGHNLRVCRSYPEFWIYVVIIILILWSSDRAFYYVVATARRSRIQMEHHCVGVVLLSKVLREVMRVQLQDSIAQTSCSTECLNEICIFLAVHSWITVWLRLNVVEIFNELKFNQFNSQWCLGIRMSADII